MSFNIKNFNDNLLFVPLGGSNEIGMNVNLYCYKGKWIMIDCGSGFADEYLPGVDMIAPDLSFIEKHKNDLVGLVLTHAHEDHLGGVQYLLGSIPCPIYATTFTANFLKIKLAECGLGGRAKINEVKPGSKLRLDPFSLEMVELNHSAPEMQAIKITTEVGTVLHTGDWKFDHDPLIGKKNDEDYLRLMGSEGVLALVCDSTNVFNAGTSGSEGDLRKSLVKIVKSCPKAVVVTTFASNLARLDTLIHAAKEAGRKVILTGRSLHRIVRAATESGYLKDIEPIVDERNIDKYKREELLIIATGCQGEPLAAVAKMAGHNHPSFKLSRGDTVIFSSKIIPGNDKKIFRLFNSFVKEGVEVITEKDKFVHVSGHPSVDELKKMYELIAPIAVIPVHGEPAHIHEQAKLARSCGIKNTVEPENGSVISIEKNGSRLIGKVHSGYLAVDGNYLINTDSPIFRERRRMRDSGVISAFLALDKKGSLLAGPSLSSFGIVDPKEDGQFLDIVKEEIVKTLAGRGESYGGNIRTEELEKNLRALIKRILKNEFNKQPLIDVKLEII